MKPLAKFAQSTLGRVTFSIFIYLVFSVVFVEAWWVYVHLVTPFVREFVLLPPEWLSWAHSDGYRVSFASAPIIYQEVTYYFWVIFWISLLYFRIYSLQKSKKYKLFNWATVLVGTTALGLINTVLLGNDGPAFFNILGSGILYYNLQYALACMLVPLGFVVGSSQDKDKQ